MSNIRLVSFSDQSNQKQKVTTSSRRNYESQVMAYGSYSLIEFVINSICCVECVNEEDQALISEMCDCLEHAADMLKAHLGILAGHKVPAEKREKLTSFIKRWEECAIKNGDASPTTKA